MQNNKPINYIQQGEIHIKELNSLLINSKKLIILITLFFSLIAAIVAYTLKPNYEANSIITVNKFFNSKASNKKLYSRMDFSRINWRRRTC